MGTTQTKKLSEAPVVQSVADADKIPIVNSSGQTVLVPFSGLLGAIKIGGRNLVKNSGIPVSNSAYEMVTYAFGNDKPKVGEKLLVSIWGELGTGVESFGVFNSHTGNGNYGSVYLGQGAYKDGRFIGILPINIAVDGYLTIFQFGQSRSSASTIERIKLERGNIPTDWSPAPEDWGGG